MWGLPATTMCCPPVKDSSPKASILTEGPITLGKSKSVEVSSEETNIYIFGRNITSGTHLAELAARMNKKENRKMSIGSKTTAPTPVLDAALVKEGGQ